MSVQSKVTLKTYFETGDFPTEQQFINLIDSLAHVDDIGMVVGTTAITGGTVGRLLFQGAGDVLYQDNLLHWDNTNKYLGVGINTSLLGRLHVKGAGNLSTDIAGIITNAAGDIISRMKGNRTTELYRVDGLGAGSSLGIGTDPLSSAFRVWMGASSAGMYIDAVDGGIQASVTAPNAYGFFVNHSGAGGTAIAVRALVNGSGAGVRYGCYMNVSGGAIGNNIAFYGINGSLQLDANDAIINDDTRGLVLKSPNGHYWRVQVDNSGVLGTTDLGTTINF